MIAKADISGVLRSNGFEISEVEAFLKLFSEVSQEDGII